MKQVCIIRHGYYPADARVRKEAQALSERGFEVDVICLRKPGEKSRENVDGVDIYRIPLHHRRAGKMRYVFEYAFSFLLIAALLPALYFRRRYSVIQVNTMPDFLVFTTLLPKLFGARIVIDMHEAMPEMFRTKFGYKMSHPLIRLLGFLERLSTSYADVVLVVCKSIIEFYQRRGLDLAKVTLVPNSPDDRLFDYSRYENLRKRDDNSFTLITHGSLEERYGIQVILKALPRLRDKIPGIKLQVIGEGEYSDRLKEIVTEEDVADLVVFTGLVPFESIPEILLNADIGIVPLIKDEFTDIMAPNKLFEYVAMKLPVVSTDTRGVREFFSNDSIAFFDSNDSEDLGNRILELYQNAEAGRILVLNAWEEYQRVKWGAVKSIYCCTFE